MGGPGSASSIERADDRGDEQPLALGDDLGVGAQRGGGGRGGQQLPSWAAIPTSTGCS